MRQWLNIVRVGVVVVTLVCAWLTFAKLRVNSDLSTLFPATGDAAALSRWTHAFGGKDPAVVLVRGENAEDVAVAADGIARGLRAAPSIARVVDRAPGVALPEDPTLAWAYAGPAARAKLRGIVTPEGMRARLAETRALLLAPTVDEETEARLARDPLRLAQVPWEGRAAELAPGVALVPGEPFTADGGRARLVLAEARGSAFDSGSAGAVVADVERSEADAARPGVTTELAGGHAIARATEQMIRRDLEVSGTVSAILASLAFVVTFRRARALVAVLPPLVLGTLWTTGIAALLPSGLDGVAIGFAAVVVGVGVDTGVHVYAALLDARRRGFGPDEAAAAARAATWRPTLTAAAVAAVAFASLGLGGLRAMRELGILCGAGELLTAVAILLVTPEIGSWLERGVPPAQRQHAWVRALVGATSTPPRAAMALALCALPVVAVVALGWPRPADALVAIRPRGLAPLAAEEHVRDLFGGGPGGQWVVLTSEPSEAGARARADRVAEALEPLARDGTIVGFDAVTTLAPSPAEQRERLAQRDELDLPSRRPVLEQALREAGFDPAACAPALAAFAAPSHETVSQPEDALAWTLSRHVAHDGGGALVATYVRPRGEAAADARARAAIREADPGSVVTGFYAIDSALRDALERDLVLVGAVALVVVAVAMRLALRSGRAAAIALATLACEIGAVGIAMRLLAIRWHVYDALVLPVLFGVTIDESMFLLHAARETERDAAMAHQAPLVAATALTTAAGFVALVACRFDGLRDLGAVGALGVLAGLGAALVVVPASLRLL
ncbi:MAG TPA: MMPL family transporter [Polyangiaceae bacterium]